MIINQTTFQDFITGLIIAGKGDVFSYEAKQLIFEFLEDESDKLGSFVLFNAEDIVSEFNEFSSIKDAEIYFQMSEADLKATSVILQGESCVVVKEPLLPYVA